MKSANDGEKYMRMALKLARRGVGSVEPNPAVGCVITAGGAVIGKGWHRKFGLAHAEMNALADCSKNGFDPASAVMYVTLEPCCHVGKTDPCTKAIIAAKITKVVVAVIDPSEHARGKGIRQLRKAGIEVEIGCCKEESRLLNAPFFKFTETKRPWVILKWAQSMDGKLACAGRADTRRWISNEKSRKDAHKLRRQCQAILVGINTVIADDPLLTARPSTGRGSLRVVLDSNLRMPPSCQLLNAGRSNVLVVTTRQSLKAKKSAAEAIMKKGAEIFGTRKTNDRCDINELLDELGARGVQQLLVEGGGAVLTSFLKGGFADAVKVYIAPRILGRKGSASITESMASLTRASSVCNVAVKTFDDDVCISGLVREMR